MYWTLISSTYEEVAPFLHARKAKEISHHELYVYATPDDHKVDIIISGSGILPMTYRLTRYLSSFAKTDLAIQVGIGGAYDRSLHIGDVVEVSSEVLADTGAEDKDGSFLDMFDLGLWDLGKNPFDSKGCLVNPACKFPKLPQVTATTVNKVSGTEKSITAILQKYPAQMESMEGAAFFYTALHQKIEFSQVRCVSNYVEPRNRAGWDLPLAIKNLNDFLIETLP